MRSGRASGLGETTADDEIASWDGVEWNPLGPGVGDWVMALAVYQSDLYAAGFFVDIDGVPINRIARWDGSA